MSECSTSSVRRYSGRWNRELRGSTRIRWWVVQDRSQNTDPLRRDRKNLETHPRGQRMLSDFRHGESITYNGPGNGVLGQPLAQFGT